MSLEEKGWQVQVQMKAQMQVEQERLRQLPCHVNYDAAVQCESRIRLAVLPSYCWLALLLSALIQKPRPRTASTQYGRCCAFVSILF